MSEEKRMLSLKDFFLHVDVAKEFPKMGRLQILTAVGLISCDLDYEGKGAVGGARKGAIAGADKDETLCLDVDLVPLRNVEITTVTGFKVNMPDGMLLDPAHVIGISFGTAKRSE